MKKTVWIIISFIVVALAGTGYALYRQGTFDNLNFGVKDCVPYNTRMEKSDKLTISWKTKSRCTGMVKFGSDLEDLQYWSNAQLIDGRYTATLDTSKYKGVKYMVIISDGMSYGIEGKAIKVD